MIFKQHFLLIAGAFIMNVFLLWLSHIGIFMVKQSLNDLDGEIIFFGCMFIIASFGLQWFALAYWLKSFYE